MEINLGSIRPSHLAQGLAVALPIKLELGRLLNALVLERLASGKTNLLLQGTKVAVETRVPLPPGAKLSLRVEALTPVVLLKIVPDRLTHAQVRNSALLNALPRQLPIAEVMNNLVANILPLSHKTPAAVKVTTQALVENTPRIENLTQPRAIQDTLLRSGTFLETRLARSGNPPGSALGWLNTDLKVLFLKLRAALPGPPRARVSPARGAPIPAASPRPASAAIRTTAFGSNLPASVPETPDSVVRVVSNRTPAHAVETSGFSITDRVPA